MTTTIQRLAALQNRGTAYELIAERQGRRVLIAYSPRNNRRGLLSALTSRESRRLAVLRMDAGEFSFGKHSADGARLGEWSIRFSGRTHREAICEGEHPYVEDAFPRDDYFTVESNH